jgi:hypothetical protein
MQRPSYGLDNWEDYCFGSQLQQEIFLSSETSMATTGPNQPAHQWQTGWFLLQWSSREVALLSSVSLSWARWINFTYIHFMVHYAHKSLLFCDLPKKVFLYENPVRCHKRHKYRSNITSLRTSGLHVCFYYYDFKIRQMKTKYLVKFGEWF